MTQPADSIPFRGNRLAEAWRAGRATLNGWLAIPHPASAEAMAHQGWDSLTIDMQHGMIDYSDLIPMLSAISTTRTVPLVRVPWLEEGTIMKTLDAGVHGVICPMINSRAEAERFARACRYPPKGIRSYGPVRALLYGGPDYHTHADTSVLAIAMIETREAVENLESILGVEEISALYIGPSDLALAHGHPPGFDPENPAVLEIIRHILTTANRAGKWVGIHNATVAYGERMITLGANFITAGSDLRLMVAGARQMVESFRKGQSAQLR